MIEGLQVLRKNKLDRPELTECDKSEENHPINNSDLSSFKDNVQDQSAYEIKVL